MGPISVSPHTCLTRLHFFRRLTRFVSFFKDDVFEKTTSFVGFAAENRANRHRSNVFFVLVSLSLSLSLLTNQYPRTETKGLQSSVFSLFLWSFSRTNTHEVLLDSDGLVSRDWCLTPRIFGVVVHFWSRIMECSVIHHVLIVLLFLWVLSYLNRSHALFYFLALIYLYLVLFISCSF